MMSVDASQSPFYAWLDYAAIRELIRGALDLPAGERLVLIKGLVPGLIDDIGEAAFEGFLDEVRIKAQRYAEVLAHPGEGGAARCTATPASRWVEPIETQQNGRPPSSPWGESTTGSCFRAFIRRGPAGLRRPRGARRAARSLGPAARPSAAVESPPASPAPPDPPADRQRNHATR